MHDVTLERDSIDPLTGMWELLRSKGENPDVAGNPERHFDQSACGTELRIVEKGAVMENLYERAQRDAQACCSSAVLYNADTVSGSEGDLARTPMRLDCGPKWNDANAEWRAGEFYKDLSPTAMSDFESLAATYCCEGSRVLFAEEQEPCSLLFLLEGRVKLTMNSSEGKRLTLGIAMPGDVLGLAAVLTGCPSRLQRWHSSRAESGRSLGRAFSISCCVTRLPGRTRRVC